MKLLCIGDFMSRNMSELFYLVGLPLRSLFTLIGYFGNYKLVVIST